MRLLEFDAKASLASVIEGIKAVPEKEVTLRIPHETPWLRNPVNEKILRKSVQTFGKTLHFEGRPEPEVAPIPEPKLEEPQPEPEPEAPVKDAVKDEAGFMVGGDIMAEKASEPDLPKAPEPEARPDFVVNAPPPTQVPGRFGRAGRIGRLLIRRWYLTLLAAFGLLLLLGAYVVFALPKADVKIIVEQRPLEREATLTASTNVTAIDVDARKIPAKTKTATESGTLKTAATGKKTVGTSAKGTVTIYNATDFDKSFPVGQKITAQGTSLKFSLDTALTVPKRTGNVIDGYTSGHADIAVTAVDIGPAYNLAASTTFTVDGFDALNFQGRNAAALTGGSSREITVVSQVDLDKLFSDLSTQLTDKAKTDVGSQGTSDDKILDQATKATVVTKTYDKKLNDEASEVTLNLSLSVVATVYNANDLKQILSKTLEQAAPDGYEVSEEGIETSAELSAVDASGALIFVGRIRANLIPKFDREKLAQDLAGKKPEAAETYLKAVASVVSYQVSIWPNLPAYFQAFPRDTKRIHISVTVQ